MMSIMSRSAKTISLFLFLPAFQVVSARPSLDLFSRQVPSAPTATADGTIGPGGTNFRDSEHFRFFDAPDDKVQEAINLVEAAHYCFVSFLGWRNPNLSIRDDTDADGPFVSTNVYTVGELEGNTAGTQGSDPAAGMAFVTVEAQYLTTPGVLVHEFGHVLHYHQETWIGQGNTGAWWESFANWMTDTLMTSRLCGTARNKFGVAVAKTSEVFDPYVTIGESYLALVEGTRNNYRAWPFFTYLTNNNDDFDGLGQDAMRQMMIQYSVGSNETPLHTLARVAPNNTVGQIVGRYWARMAYLDIAHTIAQQDFFNARGNINFDNLDDIGPNAYRVKGDRQPRYMGANINPLWASAGAQINVQITSNGAYTATFSVRNTVTLASRYVDVDGAGAASVTLENDEEISLVVANTPAELLMFDPFKMDGSPAAVGLDYSFVLTGATA